MSKRFLPVVLVALSFAAVVVESPVVAVHAQERGTAQRVLHGTVETKEGAPVKDAVVYLKDSRTTAVKSAISEPDGTYRFVQLSPNTDYELWAQSGNIKTATKSISSFDSRNDILIILKLEK